MPEPVVRHRAADLLVFGAGLLKGVGLPSDRAQVVAEVLLEGDLLGHTTHGFDLLAKYLVELDEGRMEKAGDPETVQDRGSALTWDGRRLPGPWLVHQAIAAARGRIAQHPVTTVVIRRSHHIGCLQAYLKPVTDEGLMLLLTCSDPSMAGVAPHGAVSARITPNPLAAGFPTAGDPVLVDVSMSTTTNAMTRRVYDEGGRLPGPWVVGPDGAASNDPAVVFGQPPGAVLPLGGLELGHKGFGLGLLVEALTSGLAGYGRADEARGWGASVFLQLIDPEAFGGRAAFVRETTRVAELCHDAPVAPGRPAVRLPGEGALARRAEQQRDGVALHPAILPALRPWAARLSVDVPIAL
jgi:LDH2 family malate/lactate/ureidoglycolate dehydrogenase